MNNLSEKQKAKMLKLAEFSDNPEIIQFETLLDVKEELEEFENKLEKIAQVIVNSFPEIEKQKDYTDKLESILAKVQEDEEIVVTLNII